MLKVWVWIKAKWKIILSVATALFAIFMIMLRGQKQKGVLAAANDAHKAENEANDRAKEDLADGLEELGYKKDKIEKELKKESKKKEEKLKKEKEMFIEEISESKTLLSDLADHLGAEIVDAEDE